MAKCIQINLRRCRAAQDLLYQTASERNVQVLLISEQNRNPEKASWFRDRRGDAAISVLQTCTEQINGTEQGNGYVCVVSGNTAYYSCYYSPNKDLEDYELDLRELESSIRQRRGDILLGGDFNSKSRS